MRCSLHRHLSPRTVGIVTRSLPLRGNVHRLGRNIVYVETRIDSGLERPRTDFKKGDVAFLPSTGSICFFLADVSFPNRMTPIGRLDDRDDIAQLADIGSGTLLSLREDRADADIDMDAQD